MAPLAPALAIEQIEVQIPVLDVDFTLNVSELRNPAALQQGRSDLAELDRASHGAVGRQLHALLHTPLPFDLTQLANSNAGTPLLEQALLLLASLGRIDGQPPTGSGSVLRDALQRVSAQGESTLLSLIEAIPGRKVTVDLGVAQAMLLRMTRQRRQSAALLAQTAAAPGPQPSPLDAVVPLTPVHRSTLSLAVSHRREPLELLLLEPQQRSNGRAVLISHGLWDSPANFEGWGLLLASRGYTVLLPRHPGSDSGQRKLVLSGAAPPPGPEELALRPKDLAAVIDALPALQRKTPLQTNQVVVVGHSWGATTALQLGGVRPSDQTMLQRCGNRKDPDRNLSWTLQCSWLTGVHQAAIADPRVIAVAAVSPPASLVFPKGSANALSARLLVVGGSRDWVVPPDPEALAPMQGAREAGNQLLLAQGGDHFNLRPGNDPQGGVLGAMLLAWTEAAFAAGSKVRPAPGAEPLLPARRWGTAATPVLDVTPLLAPGNEVAR